MELKTENIVSTTTVSEKSASHDEAEEAGMRISSFLLTKVWQKRCQDTNKLIASIRQFSAESQKSEENLEYKKSLYFQMQTENEDLTCQLRLNQKEIEDLNRLIDELALKVDSLEAKKNDLLIQFSTRCEECIDTNMEISDLKLKLMEVLEKNQELETQIETEKSKAERVNRQADRLNTELTEFKTQCAQSEDILVKKIEEVENEIRQTKSEKKELKSKLTELKRFTEEYENNKAKKSGPSIEFERVLLRQQATILREALDKTFENKLRKHGMALIAIILEGLKVMLPAFPKYKIKKCVN